MLPQRAANVYKCRSAIYFFPGEVPRLSRRARHTSPCSHCTRGPEWKIAKESDRTREKESNVASWRTAVAMVNAKSENSQQYKQW